MAYVNKPLFNDVLKNNPNTPFTITVQNIGTRKEGQYGPRWPADIICNGTEYTYWINTEYHYLDIQRMFEKGNVAQVISMVPDYVNGKTTLRYTAEVAAGVAPSPVSASKPAQTAPQRPTAPSGSRDFDAEARGKCRYGVTLEILKGLIAEKKPLEITPAVANVINVWTDFIMTGMIPNPATRPTPDPVYGPNPVFDEPDISKPPFNDEDYV